MVLRNREFRLLWLGRSVSGLGSWLLVVAVPAHVLVLTGSLTATGLTLAAEFLPPMLLGPFAGVVVDRWDRRRVMIAADVLRAFAVALLLFVREPDDVALVYVAVAAESVGTLAFRPAAQAHIPALVGTGRPLTAANALNSATDGAVRLLGAPLGGLLYAWGGIDLVVWPDIASYLVSAVFIALTKPGPRARRGELGAVVAELREGARFLRDDRAVGGLLVLNTAFLGANAALTSVLVPHGMAAWGGTARAGLVMSGLGVGFLLGAVVVRTLDRFRSRAVLAGALAMTAVGFVVLFTIPWAALPAAVVVGAFGSTALILVQTTVQRRTPDAVLGRVASVVFAAEAAATFAGALAGPLLAEAATIATVAWVAAGITALCALVVAHPRAGTASRAAP
ncbi:MFS transporter [Actinokineospora sp. UTMC 2448]|uniref:MFS transporter n=1 Tax=Actinokineospora sp. UTMC 2448 TaxID=2268449 RepID=UPI002164547A|nr:MFS transporter [Actinokineospora sp. UTMC 2448]UVS78802.1 Putative bacilysin exporter BacE [Actinokineospora sp. UTMC 2448]